MLRCQKGLWSQGRWSFACSGPAPPLLTSLLALRQVMREVRQLVHTSVPGVREGGVSSPAWQMAGLGSLETQKHSDSSSLRKGRVTFQPPPIPTQQMETGVGSHPSGLTGERGQAANTP